MGNTANTDVELLDEIDLEVWIEFLRDYKEYLGEEWAGFIERYIIEQLEL